MFTFKKISIALLILTILFVLFGVVATVQAQYGFSKLLGVGGLQQASVGEIIVRVIQWIMGIVGLVCVAFIIYGGVIYATSGGNEEHIDRGKKILLWSLVGLVICILAFVIANAVVGAITGGTTGGGGGLCLNCNHTYSPPNAQSNCEDVQDDFNNQTSTTGISCSCHKGGGLMSNNWYLNCTLKPYNDSNTCSIDRNDVIQKVGSSAGHCNCDGCQ